MTSIDNDTSAEMSGASAMLDATRPVRPGEELDGERLGAYLDDALGAAILSIEQFPGGHSNLTYLVRHGERELVLRRPPFGSMVKSAHDMSREHRVLSRLAPVWGKAPRPILHCADLEVMGVEFYLMERVRGVILRQRPPAGLALDEATCARLSEAFIDTLAELHEVNYDAIGLGDLGKPAGYIERQLTGWGDRYAAAKTSELPAIDELTRWLAGHAPPDGPPRLIHNDFKFDNMALDPADITRVIGVLDWEMATLGDPLMDLGTALCYWVEATDPQPLQMMRFGPTTLPGMYARRQLAARYAERSGRSIDNILFYYIYGLWKTAIVGQQIYYRYAKGLTQDQRFAALEHAVALLADHGRACLERGAI